MIAFEREYFDGCGYCISQGHCRFNGAATIRPTVDEISQMHDDRVVFSRVLQNARVQLGQKPRFAVNIANGVINRLGHRAKCETVRCARRG